MWTWRIGRPRKKIGGGEGSAWALSYSSFPTPTTLVNHLEEAWRAFKHRGDSSHEDTRVQYILRTASASTQLRQSPPPFFSFHKRSTVNKSEHTYQQSAGKQTKNHDILTELFNNNPRPLAFSRWHDFRISSTSYSYFSSHVQHINWTDTELTDSWVDTSSSSSWAVSTSSAGTKRVKEKYGISTQHFSPKHK